MHLCLWERQRDKEHMAERVQQKKSVCVCVCVCVRLSFMGAEDMVVHSGNKESQARSQEEPTRRKHTDTPTGKRHQRIPPTLTKASRSDGLAHANRIFSRLLVPFKKKNVRFLPEQLFSRASSDALRVDF
jgi:hypothetical protein